MSKSTFTPHTWVPSQFLRLLFSHHIQTPVSQGSFSLDQLTCLVKATFSSNPALLKTFKLPTPRQMASDMLSEVTTDNIYVETHKWVVTNPGVMKQRLVTDELVEKLIVHLKSLNIECNVAKVDSPFDILSVHATVKALLVIVIVAQR